jgi:hypothetical protein
MSQISPGSFVIHAKLPELGSGEVLYADRATLRLRFASGERSFLTAVVAPHLSVIVAGPTPRAPAKRTRKASAKPSTPKS